MRVHVAFTPAEPLAAPTAVVVDVLRATSTITQALASGYRRVLSCADVEHASSLRAEVDGAVLAGERGCVRVPGFDLGNSPREFLEPRGETVILSTTNGTRALIAAGQACGRVLAGSLLNLAAVVSEASASGEDVTVVCSGVQGELALDDVYVAGRIAELLGGEQTDAAKAAVRVARSFASSQDGLAES